MRTFGFLCVLAGFLVHAGAFQLSSNAFAACSPACGAGCGSNPGCQLAVYGCAGPNCRCDQFSGTLCTTCACVGNMISGYCECQ
jgi:hypothetical protein